LASLSQALAAVEGTRDLERSRRFQRHLERLLCLVRTTAEDHVFLLAAHGRELLAVQRVVERLGSNNAPRFHARFLSSIAAPRLPALRCPTPIEKAEFELRKFPQLYLEWLRRNGDRERIQLYAASAELAEEFQHLTDLRFQALPNDDSWPERFVASLLHWPPLAEPHRIQSLRKAA
jgi:hypothetical protein